MEIIFYFKYMESTKEIITALVKDYVQDYVKDYRKTNKEMVQLQIMVFSTVLTDVEKEYLSSVESFKQLQQQHPETFKKVINLSKKLIKEGRSERTKSILNAFDVDYDSFSSKLSNYFHIST